MRGTRTFVRPREIPSNDPCPSFVAFVGHVPLGPSRAVLDQELDKTARVVRRSRGQTGNRTILPIPPKLEDSLQVFICPPVPSLDVFGNLWRDTRMRMVM